MGGLKGSAKSFFTSDDSLSRSSNASLPNSFTVFPMVPLSGQEKNIGQALQRVVYIVGEFVSHRRGGRCTSLLDNQPLLLLLPYRHCREVRQDLHRPGVFFIKSLGPAVRHHEDGSPRFINLPR